MEKVRKPKTRAELMKELGLSAREFEAICFLLDMYYSINRVYRTEDQIKIEEFARKHNFGENIF